MLIALLVIGTVLIVAAASIVIGTKVPGSSYEGPTLALTQDEAVTCEGLKRHVYKLAGDIGSRSHTCDPDGHEAAARYISSTFASQGYEPVEQTFPVQSFTARAIEEVLNDIVKTPSAGKTAKNIIVEIPGTTKADEIIIAGAHYDSVYDFPAADDNASGVAVMLELARLLKSEKMARTVRFVAFDNEEPPYFGTCDMGSRRYAQLCHTRQEKVVGMFSLETMGYYTDAPNSQKYPWPFSSIYPSTGNFVMFITGLNSLKFVRTVTGIFRKHAKIPSHGAAAFAKIPGVELSDHREFWDFDYPSVMVTDTAFMRNPHYHRTSDTPDKLNYEAMTRVTEGLAATIKELANQ